MRGLCWRVTSRTSGLGRPWFSEFRTVQSLQAALSVLAKRPLRDLASTSIGSESLCQSASNPSAAWFHFDGGKRKTETNVSMQGVGFRSVTSSVSIFQQPRHLGARFVFSGFGPHSCRRCVERFIVASLRLVRFDRVILHLFRPPLYSKTPSSISHGCVHSSPMTL